MSEDPTFEKREGKTVALQSGFRGLYVVATYHDGCARCQRELEKKTTFFPRHDAGPGCKSGRKPHCTCDTCF